MAAGRHQRVMEGAVGGFEFLKRLGVVAFNERQFDSRQMGRCQPRRGVAQRDHFERGAHLGDLFHRIGIERGNPYAAARHADHEVPGFQLPKGLPHGDVA